MHIVTAKGGRYRYYVCGEGHRTAGEGCTNEWLPLPKVEHAITEAILPFLLTPERIATLAAAIQKALDHSMAPLKAELRSKQAALNEVKRRLKGILKEIIGAKGTVRKHLEQMHEEESAAHDRLLEEVNGLRGRDREQIPAIRAKHYPELAALIERSLKDGPLPLRQGIARRLIEHIEFDGTAFRLIPRKLAAVQEDTLSRAA